MDVLVYEARQESDTDRLGRALAEVLPDGCVVALCGTLGAGKTRLVQALAEACGVSRREVISPTFVLIQEYRGRRTLYHFDAYRIHDEEEFQALGPEEYFDSPALVVIEWADRVAGCLPAERLEIDLEITGDTSRRFEIRATGPLFSGVLPELARRLGLEFGDSRQA